MFRALLLPNVATRQLRNLGMVLADVQLGLDGHMQVIDSYVWVPYIGFDADLERLQQALHNNGFTEFVILEPHPQRYDEILYPVWNPSEEPEPQVINSLTQFRNLQRNKIRAAKQAARREKEGAVKKKRSHQKRRPRATTVR
ncbi:MAG: hypothetical protein MUF19_00315 [Candidatus Pacebacteria bacterium]|nr:hypothetical protein [Candidatus Paceibacterota bacterium]